MPSLFEGKCMIGIGSYKPDMREYPDALQLTNPAVVVDCSHALEESGDVLSPIREGRLVRGNVIEMSDIVVGAKTIKESTVLYKSVGMALFDVVVGEYLYKTALKAGVGRDMEL
jgi:ornithine cyclodeaminase